MESSHRGRCPSIGHARGEAFSAGRHDVDVVALTPKSAATVHLLDPGISAVSDPAFTTRRRSSTEMSSASISLKASNSRAVKHSWLRSLLGLPRFPVAAPAG